MRHILLALLMLVPAVAYGEARLQLQADGSAWFYADGSNTDPVVIPASEVYHPPGSTAPNPDDDEDDDPGGTSKLRSDVKRWAEDVDKPAEAAIMASVYGFLADHIQKGTIPSDADSVNSAMNESFEEAFDSTPVDYEDWEEFYERVLDAAGDLVLKHSTDVPKKEWVGFFRDVEAGLEDSTEGNALPPWLAPIIQELLKLLLQLITNLFSTTMLEPAEPVPSPANLGGRLLPFGWANRLAFN